MSLPVLVTPFPRTSIIRGNANNERNPPFCTFPAVLTRFPVTALINEKASRCINEEATGGYNEGAIIAERNAPSCFLFHILSFH